jgi:hypothetical protein
VEATEGERFFSLAAVVLCFQEAPMREPDVYVCKREPQNVRWLNKLTYASACLHTSTCKG